MALDIAMSIADGPGDVDISPTPTAWKPVAGKGCFEDYMIDHRQFAEGAPFVVDQVGIHNMSCSSVQNCLFEDGAVDTGGAHTAVELAFETLRVYDLTDVCGIDDADQV